jgi:hypothetical protein
MRTEIFVVDTTNPNSGPVTAEVKLGEKQIKFEICKFDETKYDLKFLPINVGVYHVYIYMAGQQVRGSPFLIKIEELGNLSVEKKPGSAVSESNLNKLPPNKPMNLNAAMAANVAKTPAAGVVPSNNRRPEPNKKFVETRRRFSSACNLINSERIPLNVDSDKNIRVELIYLPNEKVEEYIVGDEITLNGMYFFLSYVNLGIK